MRTRSNYGIVGNQVTANMSGGGLYTASDQQLLKSSGYWLGPPTAPAIVSATIASSSSVSVVFLAPSGTGGASITSYTVTSSPGGLTGTGSASPITVNGLSDTTEYTFSVTATNSFGTGPASSASNSITTPISTSYLVVGGGGGGATYTSYSPGGGAGGLLSGTALLSKGVGYTITVGGGGAAGSSGSQGANSSISGTGFTTITSVGGGWGTSYVFGTPGNGGSGGGGHHSSGPGGKGIYPGSTYIDAPRQGYDGGTGYNSTSASAGGGGGAGGRGGDGTVNSLGGLGGIGVQSSITGTALYYAGGGGGGVEATGTYNGGTGGSGVGGKGIGKDGSATDGTVNTGGGGGGGGSLGSGGSGIVILRFLASAPTPTVAGSVTITTDGSYKVCKFTGSGSITF